MRELVTMWRRPRMVALVVGTMLGYTALLLPFKGLAILSGFSSIRPGSALPVVFGLLFGPAGAWGSALGNLAGDYFGGTWNPLSPFGFLGNLLYGVLSYKLWGTLSSERGPPSMADSGQFARFVVVAGAAAAVPANVIAWGGELTGLFAFSVFASVVFVNNLVVVLLVGPPLLYFLYPRARSGGWLYAQLLDLPTEATGPRRAAAVGAVVVVLGWTLAGFVLSVAAGVPVDATPADTMNSGGSRTQVVLGAVGLAATVVGLAAAPSGYDPFEPASDDFEIADTLPDEGGDFGG